MYAALWRALPGPTPVKVAILVILAAAIVAVCFEWVFPWLSDVLPLDDGTVD